MRLTDVINGAASSCSPSLLRQKGLQPHIALIMLLLNLVMLAFLILYFGVKDVDSMKRQFIYYGLMFVSTTNPDVLRLMPWADKGERAGGFPRGASS